MRCASIAVITALLVCGASCGADTLDIFRSGGQCFSLLKDEHNIYWLTRSEPHRAPELIGPIPGLMVDSQQDTVAASWRTHDSQLEYLATGTRISQPFDFLDTQIDRIHSGKWFHAGSAPSSPDTIGNPLSVAISFGDSIAGKDAIATAGSISTARSVVALYAVNSNSHIVIWEHVEPADGGDADVPIQGAGQDKNEKEQDLPQSKRDLLTQIAELENLDPGWNVIVDQQLDLKPPLLLIDKQTSLFLIDDSGVAYSIQDGGMRKIGMFPQWHEYETRVQLRDSESASLYGRRADMWEVLAFQPEDETANLPGSKPLDDNIEAYLDASMESRAKLLEEAHALYKKREDK